jgi:RHS repeat-associated core domain protein (fragment)
VPTAKLVNGKAYSIISDHLGTPILAIDSEGNEVWNRQLDIYGRVRHEFVHLSFGGDGGGFPFIPFLYQGQYYDFETNLAYNRFRYYSPETGAYMSQDPIDLEGNNPNIYAYVEDSNCWVDVFGLDCAKEAAKLRRNLAKENRLVKKGQAAGHIVASGRNYSAVKESRKLLSKYGININDAANGIPVGNTRPHNEMHTNSFHDNVRNRLTDVEKKMIDKGYGKKAIRSSLRKELRSIGNEFLNSH